MGPSMLTTTAALGKIKKRLLQYMQGLVQTHAQGLLSILFCFLSEITKGQNQLHYGKEIIKEIIF